MTGKETLQAVQDSHQLHADLANVVCMGWQETGKHSGSVAPDGTVQILPSL